MNRPYIRIILTNPLSIGRKREAVATLERTSVTRATMIETSRAISGVGRHCQTVR